MSETQTQSAELALELRRLRAEGDPDGDRRPPVVLYEPAPADRGDTFADPSAFQHYYRIASMFSRSALVPQELRSEQRVPDILIGLDMARRIGAQPITVLQAITNIKGNAGWRSSFLIALARHAGWDLDWEVEELGKPIAYKRGTKNGPVDAMIENMRVRATMTRGGRTRLSPWISSSQAIAARWADNEQYTHSAQIMLSYRAAAFAIRLHDPGLLFGLATEDEITSSTVEVESAGTVIDGALDRAAADTTRYGAGLAELDRQTAAAAPPLAPAPVKAPPPITPAAPKAPAPAPRPTANAAQDAEILIGLIGSGREIAAILPGLKSAFKVDRLHQSRVNAAIAWAINAGKIEQHGELLLPVQAARPLEAGETVSDDPVVIPEDPSLVIDQIGELEGSLGAERIAAVAAELGLPVSEDGEPILDNADLGTLQSYREALGRALAAAEDGQ